MCDLTATDLSYAVTSAFYCGKLVLACSTYDGGLFPPMKAFLDHLQTKGFRNRRIGLMENGSWAPAAARLMRRAAIPPFHTVGVPSSFPTRRAEPNQRSADGRSGGGALRGISYNKLQLFSYR